MTSATATTFYGSYSKKQSTYKNIMDFVRNINLYDNVTWRHDITQAVSIVLVNLTNHPANQLYVLMLYIS